MALKFIFLCVCVCLKCLPLSYVRLISYSIKQTQSVFISAAITSSSFVNLTCLKYELRVMLTESSCKHGISLASVSSNQADIKMQLVAINIGFVFPATRRKAERRVDEKREMVEETWSIPMRKGSAFDFQRDADISTFESLDQARPFRSFTFHLESWPRERNDGRLLNI